MPRSKRSPSKEPRRSTLEAYDEKRDFSRTVEPPPKPVPAAAGPPTFVVQKHAARRLHYDFRLEVDGVLKSWSVPKGPSLDPNEKRLAVMVEDHPLDYGSFEGVIAKGEYGAGQVIVWDNGTYSPDEGTLTFGDRAEAEERMRQGLADGKLSIVLRGRKLKGSWTLVKIQRAEKEWLLIKHKDALADPETDILEEDRSVFSDLSIEDLKAGRLPGRSHGELPVSPASMPSARADAPPASLKPMMATLTEDSFSDPDWLFEPKLDGVRTIAIINDGEVKLLSRSGLDTTAQYPLVCEELARQPAHGLVIDGEIIATDDEGRPSFEVLAQRIHLKREEDIRRAEAEVPVLFYVFDLLHLDGYDVSAAPLQQRRSLLERVLSPSDRVRVLEHFGGEGEAAFEAAREHGLEGVVAKRLDSTYQPDTRSKVWLKIKTTTSDEFVVGGYSEGQGGRKGTFGALLLGQYDDVGKLVYVGSVGSGLDDRMLEELRTRLDKTKVKKRPFAEEPSLKTAATWVRPKMVVEVKFLHWTQDGSLRAPVFLRVRDDKPPSDVRRVDVVSTPSSPAEPDDADAAASLAGDIEDVLDQLASKKDRFTLLVRDGKVPLTNLDKEFWPKHGRRRALTKRDLLIYLAKASPYLLPHLRHRPLTLTRYPNGVAGKHFYQKHWENPKPDFVSTVPLYSSHNDADGDYLICDNLPTLLWLGQLADIELHTWYSRVSPEPDGHHLTSDFAGSSENIGGSLLNYPDFIVFDLDPYLYSGREGKGEEPELNRKAFAMTCEVALWLKDLLDSLSLSSFVKTSGRTGLHIYVPVLRQLDYTAARAACATIGHFLLRQHPKKVTMEWTVDKRTGKVFFDHNQNARGKTLASIYSPRPSPEAAVSMPLRWDELGDVYPTDFTILTAPDRMAEVGDLWAGILGAKHDLDALFAATE